MVRFNPFVRVSGRYGAPMGRHGHNADAWDGHGKLYVRHCGGDGHYDRGGAYWGHSNVYAVWTRGGGFCAYVEAGSEDEAEHLVMQGPMPEGMVLRREPLGGYYVLGPEIGVYHRVYGTVSEAIAQAWDYAETPRDEPHYVLHLSRDVPGFAKPAVKSVEADLCGHTDAGGNLRKPSMAEVLKALPFRYRKAFERGTGGFWFRSTPGDMTPKPCRLDLWDSRGRFLNQIVAFPVGFPSA